MGVVRGVHERARRPKRMGLCLHPPAPGSGPHLHPLKPGTRPHARPQVLGTGLHFHPPVLGTGWDGACTSCMGKELTPAIGPRQPDLGPRVKTKCTSSYTCFLIFNVLAHTLVFLIFNSHEN